MTNSQTLLTTGVPGLDAILGGGIRPGALVFIIGAPGAGKTILGAQIMFAAGRAGMPALVLSGYSESNDKLIQHLRPFAFFDPEVLGSDLQILTLNSLISEEPSAATSTLMRTIRESHAGVVLIDGLQGVFSLTNEADQVRQLLASLAAQLTYIGATVFVTLAGSARDHALNPLLAAVDTIIGLNYSVSGLNHSHYLEVVKQRGQPQQPGMHTYQIRSEGLVVFPRIERYPEPVARSNTAGAARALFGIASIDALLGGGLTRGTTTTLVGAPGTGKTTLALHWALQDARPDAVSIFLTFRETAEQLAEKAAAFGLPLQDAQASGALAIVRVVPVGLIPDEITTRLLELFRTQTVRRLVIDDIGFLLRALGPRVDEFCAALIEHFYGEGVTVLCTLGMGLFEGFKLDDVSMPLTVLAENLIVIQQQVVNQAIRRLFAVVHMRFSEYDRSLHILEIDRHGLRVDRLSANGAADGSALTGSTAAAGLAGGPSENSSHAPARALARPKSKRRQR